MVLLLLLVLFTPSLVAACNEHAGCKTDSVQQMVDHDPCCQAAVLAPLGTLPLVALSTIHAQHFEQAIVVVSSPPKRPPKLSC